MVMCPQPLKQEVNCILEAWRQFAVHPPWQQADLRLHGPPPLYMGLVSDSGDHMPGMLEVYQLPDGEWTRGTSYCAWLMNKSKAARNPLGQGCSRPVTHARCFGADKQTIQYFRFRLVIRGADQTKNRIVNATVRRAGPTRLCLPVPDKAA